MRSPPRGRPSSGTPHGLYRQTAGLLTGWLPLALQRVGKRESMSQLNRREPSPENGEVGKSVSTLFTFGYTDPMRGGRIQVKKLILITGVLIVVVFLWWVVISPLTWLIAGGTVRNIPDAKDRAAALSAVRQSIIQSVAGIGALGALLFTARNYLLSCEGQVTDRYTKAIEQIASDRGDERIGGIYALERVMADSARDHYTIVEVLAAFVREHAQPPTAPEGADRRVSADVQAALTVLGRRPRRAELELRPVNLLGVWLHKADLRGANLEGAVLCRAHLRGADLIRTRLQGSHLDGADLRDTKGLTPEQLLGARGLDDPRTLLPSSLRN
ncbi:pentapeptide repeat-containing protein [Streptomyces cinnamoneus]|uniref:pentapeptide repeat-containing protein n=1 Tax=Streptomyces cinnamoneus TaxID=53446 RepID=UPI00342C000A